MTAFLNAIAVFSFLLLGSIELIIFLRVILSWIPVPPGKFSQFLRDISEPVMKPFRKLPISRIGLLDLSPIWTVLAIEVVAMLIRYFLVSLGADHPIIASI